MVNNWDRAHVSSFARTCAGSVFGSSGETSGTVHFGGATLQICQRYLHPEDWRASGLRELHNEPWQRRGPPEWPAIRTIKGMT